MGAPDRVLIHLASSPAARKVFTEFDFDLVGFFGPRLVRPEAAIVGEAANHQPIADSDHLPSIPVATAQLIIGDEMQTQFPGFNE